MTRDEFTELFEIQTRGTMAAAFAHTKVSPSQYWPKIRGREELTMRDIGEIGYLTGCTPSLQITSRTPEDDEDYLADKSVRSE